MSTLYVWSNYNDRIAAVSTETAQITAISPETEHFGIGYPTIGPDGRIYVFGDQVSASSTWMAWQSIDANLVGPWREGPMVAGDVRFTGKVGLAGAFSRQGLLLPITDNDQESLNYLLLFPSVGSGDYSIAATWYPDNDDESTEAEAGFSDGDNFYYTTEGKMIWRVSPSTGSADFAVNLDDVGIGGNDLDLSAGVYDRVTNRFLAFGFGGGGNPSSAVISAAPGAVGPPTLLIRDWDVGPTNFRGSGAILDRWYYFSGGTPPIGRLNLDTLEFQGDWFVDVLYNEFFGVVVPYFSGVVGIPHLRQWQRDDTAGRRSQSTSVQASLRQGIANSYY